MTEITSTYFQGVGGAGAPPFFHGVGGAGAPPFFHGVGGAGAPPFFHGVGGAGAPPFATRTGPLLLPATAVFRPMAPTKTSIARATTPSIFDIVPPRYTTTAEILYLFRHQCQEALEPDLCFCRKLLWSRSVGTRFGQSSCRLENGRAREYVSQEYSSTKTRVVHWHPNLGKG
jgi:hypothetical protein